MNILIIEPDALTQRSLEMTVVAAGMRAYATESGEEGVDLPAIYTYDAILLGDDLHDMTSARVLRRIRDAKLTLPIIIVSTIDDAERKAAMLNGGADDYMIAPVHRGEVVARLHATIRRSQGRLSNAVVVGDVTVDADAGSAMINGNALHLTNMEMSVLKLLASRPGATIHKKLMMDALYSTTDDFPDEKILDVYICKLRAKFRAAGVPDIIRTNWGRGYFLNVPPTAKAAAAA